MSTIPENITCAPLNQVYFVDTVSQNRDVSEISLGSKTFRVNTLYSMIIRNNHILFQAFSKQGSSIVEIRVIYAFAARAASTNIWQIKAAVRPILHSILPEPSLSELILDYYVGMLGIDAHHLMMDILENHPKKEFLDTFGAWQFHQDVLFTPRDLTPIAMHTTVHLETGETTYDGKDLQSMNNPLFSESIITVLPEEVEDGSMHSESYCHRLEPRHPLPPFFIHKSDRTPCYTGTLYVMHARNRTHVLFQTFTMEEQGAYFDNRVLFRVLEHSHLGKTATLFNATATILKGFFNESQSRLILAFFDYDVQSQAHEIFMQDLLANKYVVQINISRGLSALKVKTNFCAKNLGLILVANCSRYYDGFQHSNSQASYQW